MLSIRSTRVFFRAPLLCVRTVPNGMRASFSVHLLRISPNTAKVALWLVAVERAWNKTLPSHKAAMIRHFPR